MNSSQAALLAATARTTVVMAARNAGDTIGEAIDSILKQTTQDFELIVVDDASTDFTNAVVSERMQESNLIRLLTNRYVLGRGPSRNRAILESRSEFIAIADADDVSLPTRLERQVARMHQSPNLVLLGTQVMDFGQWGAPVQTLQYPTDDDSIRVRLRRGHNAVPHQACMFRRSILPLCGIYEPKLTRCQDLELFHRISEYGELENLREALVYYRTDRKAPSLSYYLSNAAYRCAANKLAKKKKIDDPVIRAQMVASQVTEVPRWLMSSLARNRGVQVLR